MNRRHSQRGVALVITLVMLSVVTFMAVVFLGVSRRERTSVKVTEDRTTARLMADAALARAQAEVIGGIFAASNRFNYDFKVSTNFINYDGFRAANVDRYTNVSYNYPNGNSVSGDDLLQNLANLYLDPRPPVFVPPVSDTGTGDFRFYLDLNRNGRFESNGYLPYIHTNGSFVTLAGSYVDQPIGDIQTNHYMGDPEWIGMLERPDRPHSASNRFVGRYAFVVQPAGKSLDLNYIHNGARDGAGNVGPQDQFFRNQGFGSWELNLAGFLTQLNTNMWRADFYNYRGDNLNFPNAGIAFDDATAILGYRYNGSYDTLGRFIDLFNGNNAAQIAFRNDYIDGYADGPILQGLGTTNDNDELTDRWAGSDNPNSFFEPQELFTLRSYSTPFSEFNERLTNTMNVDHRGTEDRYTFYRLMSQMGMESRPGWENKINLNYTNVDRSGKIVPSLATNFGPWEPVSFFTNTAHRLLRAYMTNRVNNNGTTNFFLGQTDVLRDLGIHKIEISNGRGETNVDYSAAVHRLLQLSANIYDATTNRVMPSRSNAYPTNMPSVFRPTYKLVDNRVYVNGYVEVTNNLSFTNNPWIDITTNLVGLAEGDDETNHVNIYGMPLIIGAREGYPNFNELEIKTAVQFSRKLEVRLSPDTFDPVLTNQMYLIGISNTISIEGWNSYTNDYGRGLQLQVANSFTLTVSNQTRRLWVTNATSSRVTDFDAGQWKAQQFVVPIQTGFTSLFNSIFLSDSGFLPENPARFSRLNQSPLLGNNVRLDMWITNRLTYILIDTNNNRIVDYVSLNNQTIYVDLIKEFIGNTSTLTGAGSVMGGMWRTNLVSGSSLVQQGVMSQLQVSLGVEDVSTTEWNDYNYQVRDKPSSIDRFRALVKLAPYTYNRESLINQLGNNLAMETPFNPTRKLQITSSWQVNDPLVHYMAADLKQTNSFDLPNPPQTPATNSNIGILNDRYSPWLGKPDKTKVDGDVRQQDPLIYQSADWDFPTNKFPNIGWLGRVHRGTPWQTIYFKSAGATFTNAITARDWARWSGSADTHPTNDWLLAELFTVAPNENASRGLLSVNQSQPAAWAAVLSGMQVVSNRQPNTILSKYTQQNYTNDFIEPGTLQFNRIWAGITNSQMRFRNDRFPYMGAILSVPELTINSPFLRTTGDYAQYTINDAAYERIPQQILSLLKEDEPRVVIYAYGQSLKPAPDSLERTPGQFFQICTNYQITGEVATKTIIRFEGPVENMRAVVESFNVLPAE